MIPNIIDRICNIDFVNPSKNSQNNFANKLIVNPIDLSKIRQKASLYTSLDEFWEDVKWFVHNCEVLSKGEFNF